MKENLMHSRFTDFFWGFCSFVCCKHGQWFPNLGTQRLQPRKSRHMLMSLNEEQLSVFALCVFMLNIQWALWLWPVVLCRWELAAMTTNSNISRPIFSSHGWRGLCPADHQVFTRVFKWMLISDQTILRMTLLGIWSITSKDILTFNLSFSFFLMRITNHWS